MKQPMLKDVIFILHGVREHLQKKPKMLVTIKQLDNVIDTLESLQDKPKIKLSNQALIKIISKIIGTLPSILNAVKNLLN